MVFVNKITLKYFYELYPNFDILFYKLYYNNLKFNNYYEYYNHYYDIGSNNNYLYSFEEYIKYYNIDVYFIKLFYKNLKLKDNIDIFYFLNNSINGTKENYNEYITSEDSFNKRFPDFDLDIYKLFNNGNKNNIELKSYWYHNGRHNNEISSIIDFMNNNIIKDIILYNFIYNNHTLNTLTKNDILYWYNHKETIIDTYDKLNNILIDTDIYLLIKNFPILKKFQINDIINYYSKNIFKVNYIYSENLLKIKYPNLNLLEYKKEFNLSINNNLDLYNHYHNNKAILKYNIIEDNNYSKIIIQKTETTQETIQQTQIEKYNNNLESIQILNKKDNNFLTKENTLFSEVSTKENTLFSEVSTKENTLFSEVSTKENTLFSEVSTKENTLFSEVSTKENTNIFLQKNPSFNLKIYKILNHLNNYNDNEIILHFMNIGLPLNKPYNLSMVNDENFNFNIKIYRELNVDLKKMNDNELFFHWYNNQNNNRIYSIKSFFQKYPYLKDILEYNETSIIKWMTKDIYNNNGDIYVGRRIVNDIYEVLLDLEEKKKIPKNKLKQGISLIIRAKNEELNIKECIESVVDLVDEIIFVDNNSTDNTYEFMSNYEKIYNNIKLYKYNINVSKVGNEHKNAIKNKNPNTLGNFYNWSLSKSTYSTVFKWDADFLCIRNNFKTLIDLYNLKNKNDKFAIWFTGITLFENNKTYYFNPNSYYNEYRIFSYKNNFSWYDGDICEYTEPYLNSCSENNKYKFEYPLFFEIKRTSIDEFKERSSMIDIRDINDNKILNNLKNNEYNELIKINNNMLSKLCRTNLSEENVDKELFSKKNNIYIYTPSLTYGGGNQFIINMYKFYKSIGFNVKVLPLNYVNIDSKFNSILKNDIININKINKINIYESDYIILNSDVPFNENELNEIYKKSKIIFVTHSDVAYSNSFIKKYNKYFYKIITVNNYTIDKLHSILNIDKKQCIKLINYTDMNRSFSTDSSLFSKVETKENRNIVNEKKVYKKNNIFGVITRFSHDKNIPMLIISLVIVFRKYPNYKCYFVGSETEYYDNYLKYLCKIYNIENNIQFEGYQTDTKKYYNMFDFVILPSVSEGCSFNIIETYINKLPIICSDVGGNHEIVKNEKNGYIYEYTNIKEFEKSTIYINNYNEQLSNIGYIINQNIENNYIYYNEYKNLDVIIPYSLKCKNKNIKCTHCKLLNSKMNIFKENSDKISNTIIKMIETPIDKIKEMSNNNIEFINNNFNKNIYNKQLLEVIE